MMTKYDRYEMAYILAIISIFMIGDAWEIRWLKSAAGGMGLGLALGCLTRGLSIPEEKE